MSIKLNLFRNAGASVWGKISVILIRLAQVPFLLWMLGVDDFGRWTVLYSLPAWLNLTNLGFGSVAANEMSMAVAAGDMKKAREVFSSTIALIVLIGIIGSALLFLVVPFLPWNGFLHLSTDRHNEMAWSVLWMGLSIFVTFFYDISLGRFRAARKTHTSVLIASVFPWIDFVALAVTLHFTRRFDYMGLALLLSTLLCCVIYTYLSRRALPDISFSAKEIRSSRFRPLFRKGIAFQAFPLGNALLYQGNLMIIQAVLGPAAVALFATGRTLVRTVNQSMELVNQSIWPELSHLFGENNLPKAAKLHRVGVGMSILISSCGVIFLAIFGQPIYHLWVGKSLVLPEHLLLIFLLPIPFNAFWFTSSVVHMATNQHDGLARRYLAATILSVGSCVVLARFFGLEGAAASTLISDLVLIPFVVRRSLLLTEDSWGAFTAGMVTELKLVPAMIKKIVYKNG